MFIFVYLIIIKNVYFAIFKEIKIFSLEKIYFIQRKIKFRCDKYFYQRKNIYNREKNIFSDKLFYQRHYNQI